MFFNALGSFPLGDDGITIATGPVTGTLNATLGALTVSATGTLGAVNNGALSATLGALTATSTATIRIAGQATVTLGSLSVVSAARLTISGQAAVTLGALTLSATALAPLGEVRKASRVRGYNTQSAARPAAQSSSRPAALQTLVN